MLYGSTGELRENSNIKQPCCFFVFDDGMVVIRPPKGSVTISLNEGNNLRAMAMVFTLGHGLIKDVPDIQTIPFATAMSSINDQAGKAVQAEAITGADIISATLAKNGLIGVKLTLQLNGKSEPLVLVGGKKIAKAFGDSLEKLLGSRFTSSLKK